MTLEEAGGLGAQMPGGQQDLLQTREVRRDHADHLGRQPRVQQPADLPDVPGGRLAAHAVAVLAALGVEQVLLLVVAQQTGGDAGAAGQFAELHAGLRGTHARTLVLTLAFTLT